MNSVINILTKLGLLKDDLGLPLNSRIDGDHIFVLWISEMVRVRGADIDSIHQQRPAYFLDVPGFWHPRRELVFGGFGMAILRALVRGILE